MDDYSMHFSVLEGFFFPPSSKYNGMHHKYSALSRKQLGIGEFAALSLSFLYEKLANSFSSIYLPLGR